jgi:putrescine transport system substrate-binding protein
MTPRFRLFAKIPNMRHFVVALLVLSLAPLTVPRQATADERVLNVFNWSDYIDPRVLEDFTKETGIKVIYDTYDSDEELETRLMLGRSGYDVVVPSGPVLQRAIGVGLLQRLDTSRLPNAVNSSPEIMARLGVDDPGNQYAVNYMWFTAGIAFDADKARERLGDVPLDSWDIIFKPEILQKFADCGVYVLDDAQDLFAIALVYLKLDPHTRNLNDLRRAADLLDTLRRNVKKFHSLEYINALANGDICLAVGWSGDAALARNRASEADNGINISYVIPKEGSVIALDNLAIPADAPHVTAAYEFINFLLRPDIAARNSDATGFASGVAGAKSLATPAIANDKAIYPDAETMKHLFAVRNYDPVVQRFIDREWTRITTGK